MATVGFQKQMMKYECRMQKQNGDRFTLTAIFHSSFFIHHFPDGGAG